MSAAFDVAPRSTYRQARPNAPIDYWPSDRAEQAVEYWPVADAGACASRSSRLPAVARDCGAGAPHPPRDRGSRRLVVVVGVLLGLVGCRVRTVAAASSGAAAGIARSVRRSPSSRATRSGRSPRGSPRNRDPRAEVATCSDSTNCPVLDRAAGRCCRLRSAGDTPTRVNAHESRLRKISSALPFTPTCSSYTLYVIHSLGLVVHRASQDFHTFSPGSSTGGRHGESSRRVGIGALSVLPPPRLASRRFPRAGRGPGHPPPPLLPGAAAGASPRSRRPRSRSSSAAASPSRSAGPRSSTACGGPARVARSTRTRWPSWPRPSRRRCGRPVAAEVPSDEVGLAILGPLRELDEVAYLRFASVYQAFSSIDDFEKAIARPARRAHRHRPADIRHRCPTEHRPPRRGKDRT